MRGTETGKGGFGAAAALLVGALAIAAYVPSLTGGFVSDDKRFVVENPAVHELTPAGAARFFTDPSTHGTGGVHIYRPLRTLDFAVDWALFGDSATAFRTHNLLYHLIASLLVLALLRRLTGDRSFASPATFGALFFALHPVHVESVAFVSSRGDLICLFFFLGALLLHLSGRRVLATALLLLALLGKEAAAVFPAAAFLVDLHLRRRKPWAWYGAYLAVAAGFAGLWLVLVRGGVEQMAGWPGGSYGTSLVGVAKGFLYDAKNLVFPVDLVFDWHLPIRRTVGIGDVVIAGAVAGLLTAALAAGRRSRFAALWFLATILPVSGLLWPMAIPTAERFLLLPSVGVALAAGAVLARRRLGIVVLACFLALTISRSLDWRSSDALWEATIDRADTPNALSVRSRRRMETAFETRDPEAARQVIEDVDAFFRLYREDIHLVGEEAEGVTTVPAALGAEMLTRKAQALCLLGRFEEGLDAALMAADLEDGPRAWEVAGVALEQQGRILRALRAHELAIEKGLDGPPHRRRLAELLIRAGSLKEREGDRSAAMDLYRRAAREAPDPETARRARAALDRLR